MINFVQKVQKDVEQIEKRYLEQGAEVVLLNAYKLTFVNEFSNICEILGEDDYDLDYELLATYKGNVAEALFEEWLGYNHPEYYNFCTFEGMYDIVQNFIKNLKKEK